MSWVKNWIGRGGWAILDQGLFSGSNFLLNLILARWLSLEHYGVFTVIYSGFLLLGTVHTAIITEPLTVFGPVKYGPHFSSYIQILLRWHWVLTGGVSAVLGLVAFIMWYGNEDSFAISIFGMALASPLILFYWIMRRASYVVLGPKFSAYSGGIYLFLVSSAILMFWNGQTSSEVSRTVIFGTTTPAFQVFLILGIASMLSGLFILKSLPSDTSLIKNHSLRPFIKQDHWSYGRWSSAASLFTWIPGNFYFLALPFYAGITETAAIRALVNLLQPIIQVLTAMGNLLLPELAVRREDSQYRLFVKKIILYLIGAPIFYAIFLALFGQLILNWVYAGKYINYAPVLWILGWIPVVSLILVVVGAALRALERPNLLFWAYVVASAVSLTVGVFLVSTQGIYGAAIGTLLSYLVAAGFMVWGFIQTSRKTGQHANLLQEKGFSSAVGSSQNGFGQPFQ